VGKEEMITETDIAKFAKRVDGPVHRMKTKDIVESIHNMKVLWGKEVNLFRRRRLRKIIKDMYSVLRVIRKVRIVKAKTLNPD
jgi:hypothetical protein